MTRTETYNRIQELQKYLGFAEAESTTATIEVPNDSILRLLADDFGSHIYEPYEMFDNEEKRMYVILDKVTIVVKSKDKYRKAVTLTPF